MEAVPDLEAAVREADLVSCATLSPAPIVQGAWLKPGAHLDLVGAFNLGMREADDEALRRAQVYIDTAAALTEGGDVALALKSGAIDESQSRHLFDLCRDRPRRGTPEAITAVQVGRYGDGGSGCGDAGVALPRPSVVSVPTPCTSSIKICGLSTPETLDAALRAGADMVGFVRSRRARATWPWTGSAPSGQRARGRALRVALLVDADDAGRSAAVAASTPTCSSCTAARRLERVQAIRAGSAGRS